MTTTIKHTASATDRVAKITCSVVGYTWSMSVKDMTSGIKHRCLSCGEIVEVES